MLAEQRRQIMLELVGRNDTVSVSELAGRFDTSESTIRRDLDRLEAAGLLVKVHGGASSVDAALKPSPFVASEPTMAEKRSLNAAEKHAIAAYAAGLIEPDDFVYLDAGSTTQLMVELLPEPALRATFVTNSVSNALALAARSVHAIVVGGDLKAGTEAIVGPGATTSPRDSWARTAPPASRASPRQTRARPWSRCSRRSTAPAATSWQTPASSAS